MPNATNVNITGWEKLTPKQQDHVTRIVEATNDQELAECFAAQKALRTRFKSQPGEHIFEPCWDCRAIAKVLGYEV